MKTIRGGNGLGDALYVQAIARHLLAKGERLEVCTSWPDVFSQLDVQTGAFRRHKVDIVAHYVQRKEDKNSTQFQDCCLSAKLTEPVELRLDWKPSKKWEFDKPAIIVGLPRQPMNRKDGYGRELLPDCNRIQQAIDRLKGKATIIQVGAGEPLFRFSGIDLDLADKTTISELLDIASQVDGFLGYCSFIIPLAESFDKPLLCIWSTAIKRSEHRFIRLVQPQKLLHKESSRHVMDNCSHEELTAATNELLDAATDERALRRENGGDRRQRTRIA